jgi:hypothetical protein
MGAAGVGGRYRVGCHGAQWQLLTCVWSLFQIWERRAQRQCTVRSGKSTLVSEGPLILHLAAGGGGGGRVVSPRIIDGALGVAREKMKQRKPKRASLLTQEFWALFTPPLSILRHREVKMLAESQSHSKKAPKNSSPRSQTPHP